MILNGEDVPYASINEQQIILPDEETEKIEEIIDFQKFDYEDIGLEIPIDIITNNLYMDENGNFKTQNLQIGENEIVAVFETGGIYSGEIIKNITLNPVYVEDVNLKKEINKVLGIDNLDAPVSQLELFNLNELVLEDVEIRDLSGIRGAVNLERLSLSNCGLKDVSELKNLSKIKYLQLDGNEIDTIDTFLEMESLTSLYLNNNNITNIDGLDKLVGLNALDLNYNNINDLSLLSKFNEDRYVTALGQFVELEKVMTKEPEIEFDTFNVKAKEDEILSFDILTDNVENISDGLYKTVSLHEGSNIVELSVGNHEIDELNPDWYSFKVLKEIVLDVTAPLIEYEILRTNNESSVRFEITDNISGVEKVILPDGSVIKDNFIFTLNNVEHGNLKVVAYDKVGNISEQIIKIDEIIDMEKVNSVPSIEAYDKTIFVGDKFEELQGVTAFDAEDGELTKDIIVEINDVDSRNPGKYQVKYSVKDKEGAKVTKTIYITVVEKTMPPKDDEGEDNIEDDIKDDEGEGNVEDDIKDNEGDDVEDIIEDGTDDNLENNLPYLGGMNSMHLILIGLLNIVFGAGILKRVKK